MIYVGIDLAEVAPHQVCIMDDHKLADEFRVPNSGAGLASLLRKLAKITPDKSKVLIAAERPDGPFVSGLLDARYTVYPINPKSLERYRERFSVGGTKTDLVDARCLAGLLRTDRDAHRALTPDSPLTQELRTTTRDLAGLEKTQTMLVLQLRAALVASFPAALDCFDRLTAPTTLGFLKAFPTLKDARTASDEAIAATLKAHGYPRPADKLPEIRAALAKEQFPISPAVVHAKSLLIITLVETLLTLHQQIAAYDARLKELFKYHPDRDVFRSLPGAGPRLAVRMVAELGDDRQRFDSAGDIAAYAGAAPVTRQSGRSTVVHFRRACCKPFREVLHQFAFCSMRWCPWARAYYDAKRAEGKKHNESLRCLACIWLRIIFAMWRNHQPYHAATFLKASGRLAA